MLSLIKGTWREASRFKKTLLSAAFVFRILTALLTWYALEHGFVEKLPFAAFFFSELGVPLGLSVSLVGSLMMTLFIWGLWVSSRRLSKAFGPRPSQLLVRIWVYIAFFGFFALVFTDFAHDLLLILYNWDFLFVVLGFLIDAFSYCILPLGLFIVLVAAILEKRTKK